MDQEGMEVFVASFLNYFTREFLWVLSTFGLFALIDHGYLTEWGQRINLGGVDVDHLAIIDYKLSIPKQDSEMYGKYLKQLQNYQKELKRIRPDKENRAYLISSGGKIEQIGEAL